MNIKPMYKITREDGGLTVSLDEPDESIDYIKEGIQITADEDKLLTQDNKHFFSVVHTDSEEGWLEVDKPADHDTLSEEDSIDI